jgi:hypothetical protein
MHMNRCTRLLRSVVQALALGACCASSAQAQQSWFFIDSRPKATECIPLRDGQTPEVQVEAICGKRKCSLTTTTVDAVQFKSARMPDGTTVHFANNTDACKRINSAMAIVRRGTAIPDRQVNTWWSVDSSHSECLSSKGPAAKLDSFVGSTDRPTTRDFKDASGNLTKVEVINYEDQGQTQRVWTYYRSERQCMGEELNATKSLADRYR